MKKAFVLLIGILVILPLQFFAQDLIYLNNNSRILATGVQRKGNTITFNEYGKSNSQIKSLNIDEIRIILYENGNISKPFKKDTIIKVREFNRNFFTVRITDLARGNITMSYQHLNKEGKMGYNIPFSVSIGDYAPEVMDFEREDVYQHNRFYTGFGINFYPTGQGKARFFTGIEIQGGVYQKYHRKHNDYYYITTHKTDEGYGKLMVKNGLLLTPVPGFSMMVTVMMGIRYATAEEYNIRTTAEPGFYMSYRF